MSGKRLPHPATSDVQYTAEDLAFIKRVQYECKRQFGSERHPSGIVAIAKFFETMCDVEIIKKPTRPISDYMVQPEERAKFVAQLEAEDEELQERLRAKSYVNN